jgi:hypothetical protein
LLTKPWSYRQQFCGFSNDEDCLPINGCGLPWAAKLYYQTFTLFITNIFMGLFSVFILDGFAMAEEQQRAVLSKDHLRAFQQVWLKYDPQGHGVVDFTLLHKIIRELPAPMGFKEREHAASPTNREYRNILKRMNVKMYGQEKVTFWDVAAELARIVYEDKARLNNSEFFVPQASLARFPTNVSCR